SGQLHVRPGFLAGHPGGRPRRAQLPGLDARQRPAPPVRDDPRRPGGPSGSRGRGPLRPRADLEELEARLPALTARGWWSTFRTPERIGRWFLPIDLDARVG